MKNVKREKALVLFKVIVRLESGGMSPPVPRVEDQNVHAKPSIGLFDGVKHKHSSYLFLNHVY